MNKQVALDQYHCKLMFEDFMRSIGFTLVDGMNARKFIIEQMANSKEPENNYSTIQIIMSVESKGKGK